MRHIAGGFARALRSLAAPLEGCVERRFKFKRNSPGVVLLLEQLRGGDVHRARAAEIPYQFINLPLNPQSGFDRVHVHFFGDGSAEDDDAAPSTSLVVFDLSLSRLGDMWITLRTTPNACSCRIQTCDPNAAATIDEHAHDLSRALTDAGYPETVVEAAVWEGDRFDAVADLFRNASGLDLSA